MSNVSIEALRNVSDFQPNHNWQFYVSDFKTDWSSDISADLNLRCESIETEITKANIRHKLTFIETVDGRAYNLLKAVIKSDSVIKINLLNRQDEPYVTDVICVRNAECKITRNLGNGSATDILRVVLEIQTDF